MPRVLARSFPVHVLKLTLDLFKVVFEALIDPLNVIEVALGLQKMLVQSLLVWRHARPLIFLLFRRRLFEYLRLQPDLL